MDRLEARNCSTARRAAESFARFVGAPVAHAAHAGGLSCATPWWPVSYEGHFEGATVICVADGTVLASRDWSEGEGVVVADVELGRRSPSAEPPDRFWLHKRGTIAALTWNVQRAHGRRWYRRHVSRA
jgi:predicted amidohydrolase